MRSGVVLAVVIGVGTANADTTRSEGRIAISRTTRGATTTSQAEATFTNSPVAGVVIGTDGPCTLRKYLPTTVGLSAGTITTSGTVYPITLVEAVGSRGIRYKRAGSILNPLYPIFVEGAQITVEASGGADLPAFTSTVTAPRELAGYVPPTSLSRTSGYTATWTAGSGSEIRISLFAFNTRREGLVVVCRVPDTGTFTVPASTFALIPPSLDRVGLAVARFAETVHVAGNARVMIEVVSSISSGPFALEPLPPPPPPVAGSTTFPRRFVTVGLGTEAWRLQLGQRIARGLHLVADLHAFDSEAISEDTRESRGLLGVGVRWTPFKPRPRPSGIPFVSFTDVTAVYVTAVVGAALRDRLTTMTTDTRVDTDWSPGASLAVGLFQFQGRDWTLGPELRGRCLDSTRRSSATGSSWSRFT